MKLLIIFFGIVWGGYVSLMGCDKIALKTVIPMTLENIVTQLAYECHKDVVITDELAKTLLKETIPPQMRPQSSLHSHLSHLIEQRNMFLSISPQTITISHFQTHFFPVNYIGTKRKATSNTDVSFSGSTTNNDLNRKTSNTSSFIQTSTPNTVGTTIKSDDDFDFWDSLTHDLNATINTPMDPYVAPAPLVNKEGGIVTMTLSPHQLHRVTSYLQMLTQRVNQQVFVDVHIYNVTLDQSHTTGIDWSKIYAITNNASFQLGGQIATNTTNTLNPTSTQASGTLGSGFISVSARFDLANLIKFLSTQGEVTAVSNPKILTLDNQPSIISSGEHIYYLRQGMVSSIATSASTTTTSTSQIIESVFSGILLDITPQIAQDGTIMMRINPSITSCKEIGCGSAVGENGVRLMPPDMLKKQLSSVVRVRDGERIILGGLIHTSTGQTQTKVPLLGDIPLLGSLFQQQGRIKTTQELLIIITPTLALPRPPLDRS